MRAPFNASTPLCRRMLSRRSPCTPIASAALDVWRFGPLGLGRPRPGKPCCGAAASSAQSSRDGIYASTWKEGTWLFLHHGVSERGNVVMPAAPWSAGSRLDPLAAVRPNCMRCMGAEVRARSHGLGCQGGRGAMAHPLACQESPACRRTWLSPAVSSGTAFKTRSTRVSLNLRGGGWNRPDVVAVHWRRVRASHHARRCNVGCASKGCVMAFYTNAPVRQLRCQLVDLPTSHPPPASRLRAACCCLHAHAVTARCGACSCLQPCAMLPSPRSTPPTAPEAARPPLPTPCHSAPRISHAHASIGGSGAVYTGVRFGGSLRRMKRTLAEGSTSTRV